MDKYSSEIIHNKNLLKYRALSVPFSENRLKGFSYRFSPITSTKTSVALLHTDE